MISRFRQFLTILFLLIFSVESMAAAAITSDPGTFTTHYKLNVQKDNLSTTNFVSEANEETSDAKAHGFVAVLPQDFTSYSGFSFVSKIKPCSQRQLDSIRHQQILRLICRLTI